VEQAHLLGHEITPLKHRFTVDSDGICAWSASMDDLAGGENVRMSGGDLVRAMDGILGAHSISSA
jgi:hypothetical protein